MESLKRFRQQLDARAASRMSLMPHTPLIFEQQKTAQHHHSEVLALPTYSIGPLQDLDPESETFGKFFFMLGGGGLGRSPMR
jgi:hypothetical protein